MCIRDRHGGGADHHVALGVLDQRDQALDQFHGLGGGLVHLPVAGDDGFTHDRYPPKFSVKLWFAYRDDPVETTALYDQAAGQPDKQHGRKAGGDQPQPCLLYTSRRA